MTNDDLKGFLRRSISDRSMPDEVRSRVLARLRQPRWVWPIAAAAALLLCAAGALVMVKPEATPESINTLARMHSHTEGVDWTAPSLIGDEIHAGISRVADDGFAVPDLRAAGFSAITAHVCGDNHGHILFANRIAQVSCFIVPENVPQGRFEVEGVNVYVSGRTAWVGNLSSDQLAILSQEREDRAAALRPATILIEELDCTLAFAALEAVIGKVPGVETVVLDENRQEVRIRYDSRLTSAEELAGEAAIWGYQAVPIAESE